MQFLRAVSHTDALQLVESDSNDEGDVDDMQEPSTSAPQQDSADTWEVMPLPPWETAVLYMPFLVLL